MSAGIGAAGAIAGCTAGMPVAKSPHNFATTSLSRSFSTFRAISSGLLALIGHWAVSVVRATKFTTTGTGEYGVVGNTCWAGPDPGSPSLPFDTPLGSLGNGGCGMPTWAGAGKGGTDASSPDDELVEAGGADEYGGVVVAACATDDMP